MECDLFRQRLGQRPLGIAPPRFVVPQCVDRSGTRFADQFGQHLRHPTAPQNELRAMLVQVGGQRGEAVVQPPAARAAHCAVSGRLVVEHIDRDNRAAFGGGAQGGVVSQSQVAPEPDDLRSGHPLAARSAGRDSGRSAKPPRPRPVTEAGILILHRHRAPLAPDPGHRQDRPAAEMGQRGSLHQHLAGERVGHAVGQGL